MLTAVVVGASMAGLLAARVLADHYPAVVIVERDRVVPGPTERRPGVPQGAHVHALFHRGLLAVEGLLPGFVDDLCRRGAHRFDVGRDLVIATPSGWGNRFWSGLDVVGASRPLIEQVTRDHVLALPPVRVLQHHQVEAVTGSREHVHAVTVRDRDTGDVEELPCDLVVDASGRGSRLPDWLAGLGAPSVPTTTVDAHVGYATRLYRVPQQVLPTTWLSCYAPIGPAAPRGAALNPIEGDRWIVTLIGVGDQVPGAHEADFLPFARSLPTPIIADLLAASEPLTAVTRSRSTSNRRRHLEAVALPDNLIALGDSVLALNPVYAQGMTVAALAAHLLADCLADVPRHRLSHRYHRRQAALHSVPWLLATTSDLRYAGTDGPPPSVTQRLLGRYVDRVLSAGTRHRQAQLAFLRTLTMAAHPSCLLSPRVLWQAATSRGAPDVPLTDPPQPCEQTGPHTTRNTHHAR